MITPLQQLRQTAIATLGLLGLISTCRADSPKLYPTPQQMKLEGGATRVSKIQTHPAEDCPTPLPDKEGAYAITIKGDSIAIYSRDKAGEFYAKQSLIQLLQGVNRNLEAQQDPFEGQSLEAIVKMGTLPQGSIVDWPDLPYRGSVEGYYGQPWSHSARIAQLKFYGRNKLNTYIWAAKDDPYHHGYRCREPYPADVAQQISELCTIAQANHVKFVWAIHPANTVDWDKDGGKPDLDSLCAKLEQMYQLGVRDFGVFVDDSSGEINKASRQGQLCTYIDEHFIKKHRDVGPIIMCPTGYNRGWTSADWMGELGRNLAADIRVMWTGNTVVHDITEEGQEWVKKALGRPTFIWWNWPCTDFCRSHLGMGRTYGLEQSAKMKELMTGFVANPMEWPEASKIGLFGVADYTWNIEGFQSTQNWQDGIKRLFPSCAAAIQNFCNNNSDLGVNVHGYRREESVAIVDDIEAVQAGLNEGKLPAAATARIITECQHAIEAAQQLHADTSIPVLRQEIGEWFDMYGQMGQVGISALTIINDGPNTKELGVLLHAWHWMEAYGDSAKKPKVATLHLSPMLRNAARIAVSQCYANITGRKEISFHGTQFKSSVKISSKDAKLIIDDEPRTSWTQESPQKVGDWYALDFGVPTDIKEIKLLMGKRKQAGSSIAKGQFEYSMNGKSWKKLGKVQTGDHIMHQFKTPVKATHLRYRIVEAGKGKLSISEFSVTDKSGQSVESTVAGWKSAIASRHEKYVGINRIMEIAHMEPKQSITLSLQSPVKATWLEVNFENADIRKWADITVTLEDGSTQKINFLNSENSTAIVALGEALPTQAITSMKLVNKSSKTEDVKLTMFKIDCPPNDNRNIVANMTDGDLLSSWNASDLKRHTFYAPEGSRKAVIIGTGVNQLNIKQAPDVVCDDRTQIVVPLVDGNKAVTLTRKPRVEGERERPIYIHEVIFVK